MRCGRGLGAPAALLLLVLSATGCTTAEADPLRARIEAAGVFSPRRTALGMTELARLGQLLFFERELSGNRDISCAACHLPAEHAADDLRIAIGQDERLLFRNTLEPFNRTFADSLFWDGRVERVDGHVVAPVPLPAEVGEDLLVAQALLPLLDRHEMRGMAGDVGVTGRANELAAIDDADVEAIWDAVMARLMAMPDYEALFAAAFPRVPRAELTIVHVARAIAAFERHLWELTDTFFDRYLTDESPELSRLFVQQAGRGAALFFGEAGCSRCHGRPLLSDGAYHNLAVPQIGPGPDGTGVDVGRARVTGAAADRFAFRTPPLRNVALTAPYMHDGAYLTLYEAVRQHLAPAEMLEIYGDPAITEAPAVTRHTEHDAEMLASLDPLLAPERPLTDAEIWEIVSFLDTLSSALEMRADPGVGVPGATPSGLPIDGFIPGRSDHDAGFFGIDAELPDGGVGFPDAF